MTVRKASRFECMSEITTILNDRINSTNLCQPEMVDGAS